MSAELAHEIGRVADAINGVGENLGRVADAMDRLDIDPYSHLADALNNIATAVEEASVRTINVEVQNA